MDSEALRNPTELYLSCNKNARLRRKTWRLVEADSSLRAEILDRYLDDGGAHRVGERLRAMAVEATDADIREDLEQVATFLKVCGSAGWRVHIQRFDNSL